MKANDYIDCIIREICRFECTYNKFPEKIILSSALAQRIMNYVIVNKNEDSNSYHYSFAGIPLQVYASDKLECHLVEHTFELH